MENKGNKLKAGLSGLLGETEQNQTGGTPETTEEAQAQQPERELKVEPTTAQDEEDLINSITDEELREALRAKRMDGRGRPRKNSDRQGRRTDGYCRTSLILKEDKVAKVREIAFRQTLTMKEVFEAAMDLLIEKYESTHGVVVPHPENYKGDVNNLFK